MLYGHLFAVAVAIASALVPISTAKAQALDRALLNVFGTEKIDAYERALLGVHEKVAADEVAVRRASRFSHLYMALAKFARTEREIRLLEILRPMFDESVDILLQTAKTRIIVLQETVVGKELAYIFGQVVKIFDDADAAAEYLLWEAEILSPYGVSSANLMVSLRVNNLLQEGDAKRAREKADEAAEKIKKIPTPEISRYAEAIVDILSGLATVCADVAEIKKAPIRSVISIPGGLWQLGQGIGKLAGAG